MKTHHVLAVMMTVAAAFSGCGSDDVGTGDADDRPSASAPEPTAGDPSGVWVLVGGPSDPIAGWDVTAEIDDGRIGGTAACNGYGATVEVGNGTIDVADLAQTEMGCEPEVQQLEQAFLTSLVSASEYSVSADQLELTTPQGVWRFDRVAPVPTVELVGTTWRLNGYVDGDTVSNEAGMSKAFIELSADGTVSGATNCRRLSGQWIETGTEIVFSEFAADGDCPDDVASNLDGRIISVLGGGFSVEIDGDRLTVTSPGDAGLTFQS